VVHLVIPLVLQPVEMLGERMLVWGRLEGGMGVEVWLSVGMTNRK
jgi:hypothetical protein